MTMITMTVMHENMHQRASQQQQERQRAKEVGAVLGQQEVPSDGTQNEQPDGVARTPKMGRCLMLSMVSSIANGVNAHESFLEKLINRSVQACPCQNDDRKITFLLSAPHRCRSSAKSRS